MQKPITVLLVVLVLITSMAQAEIRKLVRVDLVVQSKATISKFMKLHPDITSYGQEGRFVDVVATSVELAAIDKLGIPLEIRIKDVDEYVLSLQRNGYFEAFHSYEEMLEEMEAVEVAHPDIAKLHDIGDSWEKTQGVADRDIWALKISDNVEVEEPAEPEVLYMALHHAREIITSEIVIYFVHYLVDNYGTDPEVTHLVDNRQLWLVPMVNPDGHEYVFAGNDLRKNKRDNDGDGLFDTGHDGVDLNRNYGYKWGNDSIGSSPRPSSWNYRGPCPFSEPETQAIKNLVETHNFVISFSYHSYGQVLIYPWGFVDENTPDHDTFTAIAESCVAYNDYEPGNHASGTIHRINGVADDWLYGEQTTKYKVYGFTPEVGHYGDGFYPDTSKILPRILENLGPNLYIARAAAEYAPRLENPYLMLRSVEVDDDDTGESRGDDDGVVDLGETIELKIVLRNIGQQIASNITGYLQTADQYIIMIDDSEQFADIDYNGTGTCEDDFDFTVKSDCPDEHMADFWLILTMDPGALNFSIPVSAPRLGVRFYEVDDSQGNNNGCADPGENVNLTITLNNQGGHDAAQVTGILRSNDPFLSIYTGETSCGTIPSEEDMSCITPLNIQIDQRCPVPHNIECYLEVTAMADHTQQVQFPISVGGGFTYDMESSTLGWTHMVFSQGSIDEWHLSTKRNHTPGGSISWKCGAEIVGDYSNGLDAALISPPVNVGNMFWLNFWHRIDAETRSTPGVCWDGGIVLIDDGSDWTQIAPLYGYPYIFAENRNSPVDIGTPCFSGTQGWTEVKFDLSSYAGKAVRFMFRFGSDAYTTREGWYIDDVTVKGENVALVDDFESERDRWDFGTGWGMSEYGHNNSTSITDSPEENYKNNADNALTYVQTFDLSACSTAALTYWHWHSIEEDRDWGYVEVSTDGNDWTKLARYTGFLDYPMHIGCVHLTDFCGPGEDPVGIRFRLVSDNVGTQDGWYLDDILFWYNTLPTVKGDVNCDERLDVTDVLSVVNIIVHKGPRPTNFELWAADFNSDGSLNALDVVQLIQAILLIP